MVQWIIRFIVRIKILNLGCVTVLEKWSSNISKTAILCGEESILDGPKGRSVLVSFGNVNYRTLQELKEEVSSVNVRGTTTFFFFFFATSLLTLFDCLNYFHTMLQGEE